MCIRDRCCTASLARLAIADQGQRPDFVTFFYLFRCEKFVNSSEIIYFWNRLVEWNLFSIVYKEFEGSGIVHRKQSNRVLLEESNRKRRGASACKAGAKTAGQEEENE